MKATRTVNRQYPHAHKTIYPIYTLDINTNIHSRSVRAIFTVKKQNTLTNTTAPIVPSSFTPFSARNCRIPPVKHSWYAHHNSCLRSCETKRKTPLNVRPDYYTMPLVATPQVHVLGYSALKGREPVIWIIQGQIFEGYKIAVILLRSGVPGCHPQQYPSVSQMVHVHNAYLLSMCFRLF